MEKDNEYGRATECRGDNEVLERKGQSRTQVSGSGIRALWVTFTLPQTHELSLGKSAARALRSSKIECEMVIGRSQ